MNSGSRDWSGEIQMHDHHQVGRALVDRHADLRARRAAAAAARSPRGSAPAPARCRDWCRDRSVTEIEKRPSAVEFDDDVEHVLDAVDLLLDRRDHGRRDHVGAGAGILPGDADHRRRDFRILRDRQPRNRRRAPRIMNTIETTEAKIGRSMKKCDRRIARRYLELACGELACGERLGDCAAPPPGWARPALAA